MFERYTEKARRVVFFARYEASHSRSPWIETEHLLLGILREEHWMMGRMFGSHETPKQMEQELRVEHPDRPTVSTSVDLPLTNESQRVLAYAAEEAERLAHRHIGSEHLLLGLLREEKCVAARALSEHGLTLEKARTVILSETPAASASQLDTSLVGEGGGRFKWHLELVDNASGERLELVPLSPFAPVPRIGEEIVLRGREHPTRTFRVVNVSYEFNDTHVETVRLRLERLSQ